jgi:hypothetical protein
MFINNFFADMKLDQSKAWQTINVIMSDVDTKMEDRKMKPVDRIMVTTNFFQDECPVDVKVYNNEVERLRLVYDELQFSITDWQLDGKKIW